MLVATVGVVRAATGYASTPLAELATVGMVSVMGSVISVAFSRGGGDGVDYHSVVSGLRTCGAHHDLEDHEQH